VPELPEVERAAGALRRAAAGKAIARVRVLHPALRRTLSTRDVARLVGRRVERVERRGKHQLLHLHDGRVLHVHFRMAGDWRIGHADEAEVRYARVVVDLTDGTRLSLVDPRALAAVSLRESALAALPRLGPEPDDPALTEQSLGRSLARRRGPIKPVLLDQRVVAGLGNIYAAEALWLARISPRARASSLTSLRRRRLISAMRETVARARRRAARYADDAALRFRVYDREGGPCPRCAAAIRRIVQAGRSTYFCPRCQRR
jgi:formamidopyrimidine-DNA glycosylase